MAGIAALQQYDSGSDEDIQTDETESAGSSTGSPPKSGWADILPDPKVSVGKSLAIINAAPEVYHKEEIFNKNIITADTKELSYNPRYEELFAPNVGPVNPFKSDQQRAPKNMWAGYVEPAEFNAFQFEAQRRTFHSYGYAYDPSDQGVDAQTEQKFVGNADVAADTQCATVFEQSKEKRPKDDRKRVRNMDPADIEGYTGPWGGYVDEEKVSRPDAETMEFLNEYNKKRAKQQKKGDQKHEDIVEETTLHIQDPIDYQGRNWLHPPHDVDVSLKEDYCPDKCFVPKKLIHTWTGHTRGVQAIRWFPKSAHLILSCGMDNQIKIWEVYKQRRLVRTYSGHKQAVRDACFNNDGTEFLSAAYDRYVKLWDTETGVVKQKFTTGKVPYCVKFNPDEDKQNMFLCGTSDKKIIQYDTRSGEIVQEYDRHLGAVNTITFFDNNRRFCSTSDDKSMRIWEWEIPVDTKLIQDASLHSMPTVTKSPNDKWMACQSMDNKVLVFQVIDEKVRFHKRKSFGGHMVAGYACSTDFSPEMTFLVSGDADGKVWIWNWKNHRVAAKWKAHDRVCIGVLWHPHETSKLATCSWDGTIKFWD